MPLSTNIYGLIQQAPEVAYVSPEEGQMRRLRLEQLMGEREAQGLKLGEAKRGIESGRRIQDLISSRPDLSGDALIGEVGKIDYKRALEMRKEQEELAAKKAGTRKTGSEADKTDLEAQIKRSEHAASVLDMAMQNPAAYPTVYRTIEQMYPTLAKNLPQQFDPVAVKAQIELGRTFVQKLADQRAQEQQKETGRHNLATEGNAAATLAETRANNQRPVFDPVRGVFATRPDRSGQSSVITPANMPQSPQQVQSLREDADKLRKEFEEKPAVKSYRDVLPIAGAAQKAPDTRAGDIQMAYAVGKILDPNSVVREGELKLVGNAATVMQQIQGELRTLTQGKGRLTPETRAQLNSMLENAVAQRKASFDAEKQSYGGIVQRRGYKPEDVFIETPAPTSNGWKVTPVPGT